MDKTLICICSFCINTEKSISNKLFLANVVITITKLLQLSEKLIHFS